MFDNKFSDDLREFLKHRYGRIKITIVEKRKVCNVIVLSKMEERRFTQCKKEFIVDGIIMNY